MSVSYAYSDALECRECDTTFDTKTWIIIDNREEPDAWDRCRKDTIHCWQCPQGHALRFQAPLLLHDSSANRLLYSPAPVASPDEASNDLYDLLARVMRELPARTREGLEERLQMVSRELLPLAMANLDPELIETVEEIYRVLSPSFAGGDFSQRLELCEYALSLFQQQEAPMLWATFMGRKANYIRDYPIGDPEENIEEALKLSEIVLESLEEHSEPIRVALARMNLGVLYGQRRTGDLVTNRQRAIQLLEQSIEIFRPRLYPQYLAIACLNLGIQFLKDDASAHSADTERALAAFEAGAKTMTPESDPETWGDLHQNLGIAYYRRVKGDASSNLERSIDAYDQALKARTLEAAPQKWVLTQMDRGNTLLVRVKGERAENIEQAIETYSKAASVAKQNGYDVDWARLQYDLSYAYQLRVRGLRKSNIEESLKAGRRALAILTREQFPNDWGNIQQNLGNCYMELARAGQPDYVEQAIESYSNALTVRSPDKSLIDWLMTTDNLSGAYSERVKGDPVENGERSFQLLEQAASFDFRNEAPRSYVRFLVNIGTAYRDRKSSDPDQNRSKAIEAFKTAIDIAKEQQTYEDLRRAVLRLSLIREQMGDWEQAYQEISEVVALLEQTYTASVTEAGKEAEAESNWFLYQMLTDVCLRTSRRLEAFLRTEEGTSRVLRDELAGLPIPWPDGPTELLDEEQRLLEKARQLDLMIRNTESVDLRAQLIHETEQTHLQLEQTWLALTKYPNAAKYISLRRSEGLSWEQIQTWLEKQLQPTAFVEFVKLRERWVAFVVRAGFTEPLVVDLPLSPSMLQSLCEVYVGGLHADDPQRPNETQQAGRQLGTGLVSPLLHHLAGVTVVCLIPQGILHYVPLHAIEHEGRPLLELMAVRYSASVAVAIRGNPAQTGQTAPLQLFVAGNPNGDLPFSEIEAAAIARRFRVTALIGDEVSKERSLHELERTQAAHLATHAYFDQVDPLASGILVAGGHVLTAREVMSRVLNLDLLVLSACDSGVQMIRMSNSLTGLARAFLYAGVSRLILSLWPVNDLSTMLLMNDFYGRLHRGLRVDEALRQAQLWLRNARAEEIAEWFAEEKRRDDHERVMPHQLASDVWRVFGSLAPDVRPFGNPHYWAPFFVTSRI